MNRTEFTHAKAEISFLDRMAERPGLSNLSRLSLQARKAKIGASVRDPSRGAFAPAKAVITYRGAPVRGVHGMVAEFGAAATTKFSDAVSAIAASLGGVLNGFGPIPNKAQNQILITGTALGSFGFEFEEAPSAEAQLTLEGTTPVSQAFELVAELLEASTKGDEELSEPASRLGTRAIGLVAEYLDKLIAYEAFCSVSTRDHVFAFSSVDQVRISRSRLSVENISENDITFIGEFLGAFPADRRFEFKTQDGTVIHGRIAAEIENPAIINAHLNRIFTITVIARTVGNGRPRYTISTLPW
ncbi:hypothetical protein A584_01836 [Pseudomonas syringae pv. theae ICMP 3923]|uniref:hypothetical protein n=1 Tax=Pseudomonas syringae TaxID=317 RepID=UPI0003571AF4|nr:hypothetical protein [Pseudomonas syringae]EPM73251.1 hypothetical protein A584_01836 [Pseudomonas syringae pv. theae ICMP 3923]MBL3872217.1 hypothetical protein [Pseudomonas syringae pv. theae]GKQ32697.1 hypothetical protein PSTH68_24280 [Pseudomonas syringae pv. theae]GKS05633.1 hypothetical protein PSTH1771_11475 [Pseudomonas syringae pv. theae]